MKKERGKRFLEFSDAIKHTSMRYWATTYPRHFNLVIRKLNRHTTGFGSWTVIRGKTPKMSNSGRTKGGKVRACSTWDKEQPKFWPFSLVLKWLYRKTFIWYWGRYSESPVLLLRMASVVDGTHGNFGCSYLRNIDLALKGTTVGLGKGSAIVSMCFTVAENVTQSPAMVVWQLKCLFRLDCIFRNFAEVH